MNEKIKASMERADKRREEKRKEREQKEQERQAIFEDILNKMNLQELHELQCRISSMMLESYKNVCSDYNDLIRY